MIKINFLVLRLNIFWQNYNIPNNALNMKYELVLSCVISEFMIKQVLKKFTFVDGSRPSFPLGTVRKYYNIFRDCSSQQIFTFSQQTNYSYVYLQISLSQFIIKKLLFIQTLKVNINKYLRKNWRTNTVLQTALHAIYTLNTTECIHIVIY